MSKRNAVLLLCGLVLMVVITVVLSLSGRRVADTPSSLGNDEVVSLQGKIWELEQENLHLTDSVASLEMQLELAQSNEQEAMASTQQEIPEPVIIYKDRIVDRVVYKDRIIRVYMNVPEEFRNDPNVEGINK